MLIRSKIYLFFNSILGSNTNITKDGANAVDKHIFISHTIPYLVENEQYFTGNSRVLIIGCGNGEETKWLAQKCAYVAGVEVNENRIAKAKEESKNLRNLDIIYIKENLPFEDCYFDTIFMHNVCEHINNLEHWFREYYRVLKRGGILINTFEPLFYSPYGAHLFELLKLPWGHLVFGFRPTQELRNAFYPNYSNANNWEERGLNRLTENKYKKLILTTGLRHKYYKVKTVKNIPLVATMPFVKNLFISKIENILEKN